MKLHITSTNWKQILLENIGQSNLGNIKKELYRRDDLHALIIDETNFCLPDTSIKVRLTYIANDVAEMNSCNECHTLINDGGKKQFCTFSCRAKNQAKDKDVLKKRADSYSKTYLEKSFLEKQQIKERRKTTLRKRYGVDHNFNIDGFKEKRKITWQKKYGTKIAQRSDDVKEKARLTCKKLYGGPNPLSHPAVKEKWMNSFKEKYGESNPMHVNHIKRKAFATRLGIPIEEVNFIYETLLNKDSYNIEEYTLIVRLLTEESLELHGSIKFGIDWQKLRGKYKYHIDHRVSIRTGYLNNINPKSIAHIENLQLIPYKENLSKGSKDNLTLEQLNNIINEYEKIKTP